MDQQIVQLASLINGTYDNVSMCVQIAGQFHYLVHMCTVNIIPPVGIPESPGENI
jgi:hypothetical protein